MIDLQNVMDVLGNLISERLSISLTSINRPKDEEVAVILFENVQSMLNCISYPFEDKDTLDHDFNIELSDDDSPFENNEDDDDCNKSDASGDTDYNDECKNENSSTSILTGIHEKCRAVLR